MLGHIWAPYQKGYGQARPVTVDNGGDPTGLVRRIRWTGWGNSRAIGIGISTYVWPGTVTADNRPTSGARVVAFHLGTCRGRPSYNAVVWYFPKYGDTFHPNHYINACTGAYVGFSPKTVSCPNVPITDSKRIATQIDVTNVSCVTASRLIAHSPAARFVPPRRWFVWHFMQSGFRCGSSGNGSDPSFPIGFGCGLDNQHFYFRLTGK